MIEPPPHGLPASVPTVSVPTVSPALSSTREENSPNGAGRLLVADELAERWRVPRAHVYRLAREGRLQTVRLGRYRRWRLEAVEQFEREGGCSE